MLSSLSNHSVQRLIRVLIDEIGLVAERGFDVAVTIEFLEHLNGDFVACEGGKSMAANVHGEFSINPGGGGDVCAQNSVAFADDGGDTAFE